MHIFFGSITYDYMCFSIYFLTSSVFRAVARHEMDLEHVDAIEGGIGIVSVVMYIDQYYFFVGYTVIVALGLLGQQKYHAVSSFQSVNFDCFNLILIRPSVDPSSQTEPSPSLDHLSGTKAWSSDIQEGGCILPQMFQDILLIYWVYFPVGRATVGMIYNMSTYHSLPTWFWCWLWAQRIDVEGPNPTVEHMQVASCHGFLKKLFSRGVFGSKPGSFPGWNPAIVGAEQNNTPQLHDLMVHESPKWQVLRP